MTVSVHGRVARGGHVLPKVAPGPTIPNPFMPCGRATPKTALWSFKVWLANGWFCTPHAMRLCPSVLRAVDTLRHGVTDVSVASVVSIGQSPASKAKTDHLTDKQFVHRKLFSLEYRPVIC
jgi:hypothetical protein